MVQMGKFDWLNLTQPFLKLWHSLVTLVQLLICAVVLNTLGSTPLEVEEEVVEVVLVLDLHFEKPLLGRWVSTLKPGLGLKLALELALVWHHRSPSSLELRLNQVSLLLCH